ncbi:tetratricopeptide repeat protein [Myxococcota bacterium]|nr:tetratricopeptide repeat protein [Myxococcota bacterium]
MTNTPIAPTPTPSNLRTAALSLSIPAAIALISMTDRVHSNPTLLLTFWGVAGAIALAQLAVLWTARAHGRTLEFEFTAKPAHYVQATLHSYLIMYWGYFWSPFYREIPLIAAQILFLYGLEMVMAWGRGRPWKSGIGSFPIIFSTNFFLWFHDDWFFMQFLMVAVGALGKEFFTWTRDGKRTHIVNPSAFSLSLFSLGLLLTGTSHYTTGWDLSATLGYPPYIFIFIFCLGLVVQTLFGVTLMTFSAVSSLAALTFLYHLVFGAYLFEAAGIPSAVFLGCHLLITDPATTPRSDTGKVFFGVLYGIGVFATYALLLHLGTDTYYDKLLCLPLLNLSVRWIDRAAARFVEQFNGLSLPAALTGEHRNRAHIALWICTFAGLYAFGWIAPADLERRVGLHVAIADVRMAEGNPEAAVGSYLRVLDLLPEDVGSQRAVGLISVEQGNWARGEAVLTALSPSRPGDLPLQDALARARLALDKPARALQPLQLAASLDPQNPSRYTDIARTLERVKDFRGAAAGYREALNLDPNHAEAHADLGYLLHWQGNIQGAVEHYRAAVAANSRLGSTHGNLSLLLRYLGQDEDAERHFDRFAHLVSAQLRSADGATASGPVTVDVAIFDAETGGTKLYQERHVDLLLKQGTFHLNLGEGAPDTAFGSEVDVTELLRTEQGARFVEITTGGQTLLPRSSIPQLPAPGEGIPAPIWRRARLGSE